MNNKSVVLKKVKQLLELKYSGSTPKNYSHHIALFLEYAKNVPDRINNEDVLDYNISIRNKSNSYRNIAINAIRAYFNLYLRKKLHGFSSTRPPNQKRIPVVFDCDEMALKIDSITNLKHQAILAIALCCWLRKSELLNIKLSDINGKLQTLHIKQSKGCKDRILPISTKTLTILRTYYKVYKPKIYLFEGQQSDTYSAASVDKITKKYLYPSMRFHNIRASGATYALKKGTDIKTVSHLLGHAKIQTTEYYIPVLYNTVMHAI
ncbi:integrase [Cellulophaga phage Ingeline_1]|uniref:Integrase n=1 Tax=Cellulophaga phage Ingeline_1 TaxID=2745674 RepID=A0A8E4ZL58_9CAUD|nr:integrase [Cellulophaga phage Ingeline_1]QQV90010.1 integrase [Cellulophaga phage Ingeline_2]QQV90060.1 integrase [Cellulophaga phage Ingeline_3]QQV90110.1 integrase [Cellulophaga phage Ingeline_4]QQV90160.1 integrase [Cellulophaga phage Ingeline_5]QQV90209.1 integrase [Cellulophaga phage Ingeline_6]QQV90259.1 integrase [Cellulophaga phage Ingeline_7]QQV90321.1 integrase [Cellulophaga phage Ingeline_8]